MYKWLEYTHAYICMYTAVQCHKTNHERGKSGLLIIFWVDPQCDLTGSKVQVYLDAV